MVLVPEKLSVLVEEERPGESRAAFSGVEAVTRAARAVIKEFDIETLREGLDRLIGSVLAVLPEESAQAGRFALEEVQFTAAIEGSGKVSLVAAGTSATGRLGIQLTLRRPKKAPA